MIGTRLVVSSHVVLRYTSQPIQSQGQQLRKDETEIRHSKENLRSLFPLYGEGLEHSFPLFFKHPSHLLNGSSVASKHMLRGMRVYSCTDLIPQLKSAPLKPRRPSAEVFPHQL